MAPKPAYVRPDTLEEALQFLEENGSETRMVAGGTDILVDLRAGKVNVDYLMDISRLEPLRGIEPGEDGLFVGSGVTLTEIRQSSLIADSIPALYKSTLAFGSRQIRNVATIGGNAANASPSADTIPPLIAHDGVALVKSLYGERRIPVEELASGPYRSTVGRNEIITGFLVRPSAGKISDFQKIGRRKSLAVARMNMASALDWDADDGVTFIRLALGACTPTSRRMRRAEAFLMGKRLTGEILLEGAGLVAEEMVEVTGRRPSTVYKEEAVQGLFLRMFYPLGVGSKR